MILSLFAESCQTNFSMLLVLSKFSRDTSKKKKNKIFFFKLSKTHSLELFMMCHF